MGGATAAARSTSRRSSRSGSRSFQGPGVSPGARHPSTGHRAGVLPGARGCPACAASDVWRSRPSGARGERHTEMRALAVPRFCYGGGCVVDDADGRAGDVPGPPMAPVVDARRAAVPAGRRGEKRVIRTDSKRRISYYKKPLAKVSQGFFVILRCRSGATQDPTGFPAKIDAPRGALSGNHVAILATPGETPGPCAAAALGVAICYDMPKHIAASKAAA